MGPDATAGLQRLIKPTLDTPFHIDYEWWKREGQDFRAYLMSHLCPEHRERFLAHPEETEIDDVDPETAEVRRIDGLWHALLRHCSRRSDFITSQTPLTDAIFRLFLVNGNRPMTPKEIAQALQEAHWALGGPSQDPPDDRGAGGASRHPTHPRMRAPCRSR